jgi:hypothetical protein
MNLPWHYSYHISVTMLVMVYIYTLWFYILYISRPCARVTANAVAGRTAHRSRDSATPPLGAASRRRRAIGAADLTGSHVAPHAPRPAALALYKSIGRLGGWRSANTPHVCPQAEPLPQELSVTKPA